jgi:hypothetical protein
MLIIDINDQERDCEEIFADPQWPGFITAKYVSKNQNHREHLEWYPVKEFLEKNQELTKILDNIPIPPKDDLGDVTHSGEFYLEDITKDWQNNIYVGFYVWISRGTGESQVRLIKSNTKNTLTIDPSWDILPNKKSQYVISNNIHDVKILGNTLPQFES